MAGKFSAKKIAKFDDILFKPLLPSGTNCLKWVEWVYQRQHLRFSITEQWRFDTDESYLVFLDSLNPNELHHEAYRTLELNVLNHLATQQDIQAAFEKKLHKFQQEFRSFPSERARRRVANIINAYKVLSSATMRNQIDMPYITALVDLMVPSTSDRGPEFFFRDYGPWFEAASTFSTIQPAPLLGHMFSSWEHVNHFYDFWRNFKSSRPELTRQKILYTVENHSRFRHGPLARKREKGSLANANAKEASHVQRYLLATYRKDPRVKAMKDAEREKLLKKQLENTMEQVHKQQSRKEIERQRRERKVIARRAAAEVKLILERDRKLEEKNVVEKKMTADEQEKVRIEAEKSLKDAQRKAHKKERQRFRSVCKENGFYASSKQDSVKNSASVDEICEILSHVELTQVTSLLKSKNRNDGAIQFKLVAAQVADRLSKENFSTTESIVRPTDHAKTHVEKEKEWDKEELEVIRAVGKMKRIDRWADIEVKVPGRSKVDCIRKYNEMFGRK